MCLHSTVFGHRQTKVVPESQPPVLGGRVGAQQGRSIVVSSVGRRYRYGASFVDQASGVRFEGHHPLERPDLWNLYITEAEGTYRSRGFEGTLRRQELEDGHGVPLFFLGFNRDGDPVAGVRFHGPLDGSYQFALVEEMAASPEIGDIGAAHRRRDSPGRHRGQGSLVQGRRDTGHSPRGGAVALGHPRDDTGSGRSSPSPRCPTRLFRHRDLDRRASVRRARGCPSPTTATARSLSRGGEPAYRAARARHTSRPSASRPSSSRAARSAPGSDPVEVDSPRTRSIRPLVLDVASRSHREVLRVLREDPSLQLVDRLAEQREPARRDDPRRPAPRWSTRGTGGSTTRGVGPSCGCSAPRVLQRPAARPEPQQAHVRRAVAAPVA